MRLTEIYADDRGETHFRVVEIDFETRAFAPPSMPVEVSAEVPATTALFMKAPPGWDREFHATPRRQFCIMLKGRITIAATDGETIVMGPGDVLLVNDEASRGHLSVVQDDEDAVFIFVGVADDAPLRG